MKGSEGTKEIAASHVSAEEELMTCATAPDPELLVALATATEPSPFYRMFLLLFLGPVYSASTSTSSSSILHHLPNITTL